MKTILHILEVLEPIGGTSVKLSMLVSGTKDEFQHVFVTYRKSPMADHFRNLGAVVIDDVGTSPWVAARAVKKAYAAYNPDILATHFGRALLVKNLATPFAPQPWIHHEHGPASIRKGLGRLIASLLMQLPNLIIANSDYTRRSFVQRCHAPLSRIKVVFNPVQMRPASTPIEKPKDQLTILHVGGMTNWRDQKCLIAAFAAFSGKFPNARLVLIGDGPMRQALEKQTKGLEIQDRVEFVGYSQKIGDWHGKADIYVNPALEEGFGIATVEAMNSGLPVVLANAGANPELIKDGTTGLLYAPSDELDLCAKLTLLAEDSLLRKSIGAAGQAHALTTFTPQNYCQGFTQLALGIHNLNSDAQI